MAAIDLPAAAQVTGLWCCLKSYFPTEFSSETTVRLAFLQNSLRLSLILLCARHFLDGACDFGEADLIAPTLFGAIERLVAALEDLVGSI